MLRTVRAASRRDRKKAMRSRAWLNGVEVTRDCFMADDRAGVVGVYVRNAAGNIHLNPRHLGPVKAYLRGSVQIGRQAC